MRGVAARGWRRGRGPSGDHPAQQSARSRDETYVAGALEEGGVEVVANHGVDVLAHMAQEGVHPAQQSACSKEEGNVADQMTHRGALEEGGVDVLAHMA